LLQNLLQDKLLQDKFVSTRQTPISYKER
jgi:hypothetical protein